MNFKYDPELGPKLGLLNFDAEVGPYDPQHFKAQLESETGRRIFEVVTSRDGKVVAALATRRRDPVVPDLEPFIEAAAGPEAFQDRYKQFTGHLVKHVVQCMEGEIERKGVDVTIPDSSYTRATRYRRSGLHHNNLPHERSVLSRQAVPRGSGCSKHGKRPTPTPASFRSKLAARPRSLCTTLRGRRNDQQPASAPAFGESDDPYSNSRARVGVGWLSSG